MHVFVVLMCSVQSQIALDEATAGEIKTLWQTSPDYVVAPQRPSLDLQSAHEEEERRYALSTAVAPPGAGKWSGLKRVRWECFLWLPPTPSDSQDAIVARERMLACLDWNATTALREPPLQSPGGGNTRWCGVNREPNTLGSRGFPWVPSTPVQSAMNWLHCFEHQAQAPPPATPEYWLVLIGDSNTRIMTMSLVHQFAAVPGVELEIRGPSKPSDAWYHGDMDYLVRRRSVGSGPGTVVARISQRFSSSIERTALALEDLRVLRNKAGVIWNPTGTNDTASWNTNSQPSAVYIANSLWWMHTVQEGPFVGATPHTLANLRGIVALTLVEIARWATVAEVKVVWGLYGDHKDEMYQGKGRVQMDIVDAVVKSELLQHDPTQDSVTTLPIRDIFNAGGDYCTGSTPRQHIGVLGTIHYSFAFQMTLLDLLFQQLCSVPPP